MRVLFTPTFDRTVKKLHPKQKHDLDTAVLEILRQPELGNTKLGDLAGVKVYKFRMINMTCLLAYRILDEQTLKLLMVGPHENFYRELKRAEIQ
jgi:mRNA interferase RelE/StbE